MCKIEISSWSRYLRTISEYLRITMEKHGFAAVLPLFHFSLLAKQRQNSLAPEASTHDPARLRQLHSQRSLPCNLDSAKSQPFVIWGPCMSKNHTHIVHMIHMVQKIHVPFTVTFIKHPFHRCIFWRFLSLWSLKIFQVPGSRGLSAGLSAWHQAMERPTAPGHPRHSAG